MSTCMLCQWSIIGSFTSMTRFVLVYTSLRCDDTEICFYNRPNSSRRDAAQVTQVNWRQRHLTAFCISEEAPDHGELEDTEPTRHQIRRLRSPRPIRAPMTTVHPISAILGGIRGVNIDIADRVRRSHRP